MPSVGSFLIKLEKREKLGKTDRIFGNMLLRNGKIKNSLVYALVSEGKTKKEAKEIISKFNIFKNSLEKKVSRITAGLIERIRNEIEKSP